MTSKLKCPFCKEEIISDVCCMFDKKNKDYTSGRQIYKCNKCGLFGNKELVQKLIRTRKALDLAIQRLEQGKQKFGKSRMGPNKETAMLCEIVINEIKQLIKD